MRLVFLIGFVILCGKMGAQSGETVAHWDSVFIRLEKASRVDSMRILLPQFLAAAAAERLHDTMQIEVWYFQGRVALDAQDERGAEDFLLRAAEALKAKGIENGTIHNYK